MMLLCLGWIDCTVRDRNLGLASRGPFSKRIAYFRLYPVLVQNSLKITFLLFRPAA